MSQQTKLYLAWGIMVLAVILAGLLGGNYVIPAPPAPVIVQNQAPVLAPPVTGAQAVEGRAVVISSTAVITADKYTQSVNWHRGSNPYTYADIYYAIDQDAVTPSNVNTTTLTLQTSYDNSTWISYVGKADPGVTDGSANLVTANAADASGSFTVKVQWPYMRLYWNVTDSGPITVTARLYLR